MATKRVPPKSSAFATSSTSPPLLNVLLLGAAICGGVGLLFARGRLTWPPNQLLASIYTLAGCLAMVGPILLHRRDSPEVGLGEVLWTAGGLVVWIFDLAAVARGEFRALSWATPLGYQPMGLTILAVLIASWRCRIAGSSWSWTNVTGWTLGLFWVAMAASTLLPPRILGVAMR